MSWEMKSKKNAERCRQLRKSIGISREKYAARLELSGMTLARAEVVGEVNTTLALRLKQLEGISLDSWDWSWHSAWLKKEESE